MTSETVVLLTENASAFRTPDDAAKFLRIKVSWKSYIWLSASGDNDDKFQFGNISTNCDGKNEINHISVNKNSVKLTSKIIIADNHSMWHTTDKRKNLITVSTAMHALCTQTRRNITSIRRSLNAQHVCHTWQIERRRTHPVSRLSSVTALE